MNTEIKQMKHNLKSNLKTLNNLVGEGIEKEEEENSEKQRLIGFLTKSLDEKEEAIRAKESDLECPVCLETPEGEIFCCVEQHLVCSNCRPNVRKCPQCRQPYPPTPMRHRYAEMMVGELKRLREERDRIVQDLVEMIE